MPQPTAVSGGCRHHGTATSCLYGTSLPAPPEPEDSATHIRWGLQVSVDDVVSENVPGAQAAHTTLDVSVPSGKRHRSLSPAQMHGRPRAGPRGPRTSVHDSPSENTHACTRMHTRTHTAGGLSFNQF